MIIKVSSLDVGKVVNMSSDIVFSDKYVLTLPLLKILSTHVDAQITNYDDFIAVKLSLVSRVVLQCSYTLEGFETTIKASDELRYNDTPFDGDEELIIYRGNTIDLTQNIFNLLCASIPMSPKKSGAKPPVSGATYTVLSEEEYYKKRAEKTNSVFADIDLDERD